MLADEYQKRVMIVDTSNEIGGDGDIPHAGIGSARRMQVPNADMQHMVLAHTSGHSPFRITGLNADFSCSFYILFYPVAGCGLLVF